MIKRMLIQKRMVALIVAVCMLMGTAVSVSAAGVVGAGNRTVSPRALATGTDVTITVENVADTDALSLGQLVDDQGQNDQDQYVVSYVYNVLKGTTFDIKVNVTGGATVSSVAMVATSTDVTVNYTAPASPTDTAAVSVTLPAAGKNPADLSDEDMLITMSDGGTVEVSFAPRNFVYFDIGQNGSLEFTGAVPLSGTTYLVRRVGAICTLDARPDFGYEVDTYTVTMAQGTADVTVDNNDPNIRTLAMPGSDIYKVNVTFAPIDPTPQTFGLRIEATAGGRITAGTSAAYAENTTINIAAEAVSNKYEFTGWQIVSGKGTIANASSKNTTFTTGDAATVLRATFKESDPGVIIPDPTYQLTVNASTGGYVQAGAGEYEAGETVAISAVAYSGYRFSSWSIVSGSGTFASSISPSTTFTMPGEDATIQANFTYDGYTGGTIGGGSSSSGGSSSGGSSSSKSSSSGNKADTARATAATAARATTATTAASPRGASSNVSADGAVSASAIRSQLASAVNNTEGASVSLRTRNAESISASTLEGLAKTAASSGKTVVLRADTTVEGSSAIQGRLYVEPAKLAGNTADLKLGVYTESAKTSAVKAKFEKAFDNSVAVVHLEQKGSLGARMQIAAKVDLTGMDTDNLVFYVYDRASNSYSLIDNPEYSIDGNGYLRFYTEKAGDIIVSEGNLTK